MPYINLKTNKILNETSKKALKEGLGQAIELIPGKSQQWMMLCLEGDLAMYFGGDDQKGICMVEICCYGQPNPQAYENVTKAVCQLCTQVLGVAGGDVYVKYSETMYWGCDGQNL